MNIIKNKQFMGVGVVLLLILGGFFIFSTKEEIDFTGEVKEFSLVAKNWEFVGDELRVSEGDKVIIKITSEDNYHGFALPDFDVSEIITPGEEKIIEFIANKKGIFTFFL